MAAQAKNKTILEEFMVGCKKGFYVGVENIMLPWYLLMR